MITATLLLGRSIFFASQVVQLNVCHPLMQTVISAPVTGANTLAVTIQVTGQANPDVGVQIRDNSQTVANINSDSAGDFAASIPLVLGTNRIEATASNTCGDTADATAVTITRLGVTPPPAGFHAVQRSGGALQSGSGAPTSLTTVPAPTAEPVAFALTLDNVPAAAYTEAGAKTYRTSLVVSGHALPSSHVAVTDNGKQVAMVLVGEDGRFSVLIPLVISRNEINVSATGSAGQSASKSLLYIRTAPSIRSPWYKRGIVQAAEAAGAAVFVGITFLVLRARVIRGGRT